MKTVRVDQLPSLIDTQTMVSDWFKVTQVQIDQFADCTLDHQFIHVDPVRAAETEFGSTIAHGFLSLSMLPHFAQSFGILIEGAHMGINYGFDKIRFLSPVKVNSQIRGKSRLTGFTEKRPGQILLTTSIEVEIEGSSKPALKADWLTMQIIK